MTPVAAVVFDVDGTLVDHDRAQHEGLAATLAAQGSELDAGGWSLWRDLEEHHFARYLAGELSFQGQRRERVRAFTGDPLSDRDADAWFDDYRRRFEAAWTVFDDVPAALDRLLASGTRLAAFSNVSGEYTRTKLTRVGLVDRFERVQGVDDLGAPKPTRATFRSLAEAFHGLVGAVAHVGDRYETDARGAADAELCAVWVDRAGADPRGRRPQGAPDPRVRVVPDLTSVPDLLQRWT